MSFATFGSRLSLDNVLRRQILHQATCRVILKQTANLTSLKTMEMHGKTPLEEKPWPYKERPYNWFYQFFDRTTKRMDENSKVVIVDGPLGVGKTAIALNLAHEFDLKYINDVEDKEVFLSTAGYDTKTFDEHLPLASRRCSFEEFYSQSVPGKQLSRIAMTQRYMNMHRFYRYCEGLCHLFNTGQGVVMERGVHSDIVFAKTLAKFNYIPRPALRYFLNANRYPLVELKRPHVYIYIDASVKFMQEAIKKRNIPWEVNSPVLTEAFLTELRNNYRQILHEKQEECQSEILIYDAANLPDMEMLVEDIEKLDLDYHDSLLEGFSDKFKDWGIMVDEDDWNEYRMKLSNPHFHFQDIFAEIEIPFEAKGLYLSSEDAIQHRQLELDNPKIAL